METLPCTSNHLGCGARVPGKCRCLRESILEEGFVAGMSVVQSHRSKFQIAPGVHGRLTAVSCQVCSHDFSPGDGTTELNMPPARVPQKI